MPVGVLMRKISKRNAHNWMKMDVFSSIPMWYEGEEFFFFVRNYFFQFSLGTWNGCWSRSSTWSRTWDVRRKSQIHRSLQFNIGQARSRKGSLEINSIPSPFIALINSGRDIRKMSIIVAHCTTSICLHSSIWNKWIESFFFYLLIFFFFFFFAIVMVLMFSFLFLLPWVTHLCVFVVAVVFQNKITTKKKRTTEYSRSIGVWN